MSKLIHTVDMMRPRHAHDTGAGKIYQLLKKNINLIILCEMTHKNCIRIQNTIAFIKFSLYEKLLEPLNCHYSIIVTTLTIYLVYNTVNIYK